MCIEIAAVAASQCFYSHYALIFSILYKCSKHVKIRIIIAKREPRVSRLQVIHITQRFCIIIEKKIVLFYFAFMCSNLMEFDRIQFTIGPFFKKSNEKQIFFRIKVGYSS
jgi:hypothetical protein